MRQASLLPGGWIGFGGRRSLTGPHRPAQRRHLAAPSGLSCPHEQAYGRLSLDTRELDPRYMRWALVDQRRISGCGQARIMEPQTACGTQAIPVHLCLSLFRETCTGMVHSCSSLITLKQGVPGWPGPSASRPMSHYEVLLSASVGLHSAAMVASNAFKPAATPATAASTASWIAQLRCNCGP